MDEKLTRRLAAYAATAGVALTAAPEAGAQVVYHDFEPDVLSCDLRFDFDDNGSDDVDLSGSCVPANTIYFVDLDGLGPSNGILAYWNGFLPLASRLSSGEAIGPADGGSYFADRAWLAYAFTSGNGAMGAFLGQEGYAGFRFVGGDGGLHYGWLRLSGLEPPFVPTVYGYAYEASPDTPILAGAVSAALLDGSVSQTAFPASGGTLAYTFTVTNTTGAPLPLDLWLDADRDGAGVLSRRLGSGTLPAGATVTRTVRVRVPGGAPAGDYDVRFKLGDFATRQFITFERYAVTKEAAAGVGEDEAFAVSPEPGDLFAEAASVFVGTHALSAPSPNPSTGQVGFTLQVAEAQAVRVEVLDALGRRVAVLHDGALGAGEAHRLVFDGSGLSSGVYVVRAVGETFADTRVVSLAR